MSFPHLHIPILLGESNQLLFPHSSVVLSPSSERRRVFRGEEGRSLRLEDVREEMRSVRTFQAADTLESGKELVTF